MTKRPLLATLATLLLTSAAFATPVLKADIMVSAAVVTVGDMFDNAGLAAEDPLFRAPLPGTTGVVPLADVTAAAARIGIEAFDANGLQAIRVSRAAAVVDETVLTSLIVADLKARGILSQGMTADTLFATPVDAINAEAVASPASILNLRYLPATGAFTARFAIAGQAQPLDVSGSIELMIDMPHLTGSLPAGTVITADHLQMRPVPLRFAESAGVVLPEQAIGMALTRQSRDGMMLRPSDLAAPLMIAKNDQVTIYFRQGPMTLTVKGQAITGAAAGAPLQVLNLMSKRVISARALAPGAVEVSSEPLALAGL
jgi:flagella basal body P-ring formation protein FlgA